MERFKEIRELGRGGFGKTLLVEDLAEKNCRVVIKVPLSEEMEAALLDDVIHLAHLQASVDNMEHPNIVRYLGHSTFQGHPVMILEYVQGKELRKMIGPMFHKRAPMELDHALRITMDACSGLTAAHKAHVFHSDIKPDNILVRDADGVAILIDFGISAIMRTTAAANAGGTVPYMAPEALSGKAAFRADIWSLSVTLYELVTGHLPFPLPPGNVAQGVEAIKAAILHDDPIPPTKHNPKIDERLNSIILRGLEKKVANRFQSAQEMRIALEAHLRGEDYIDVKISRGRELIKEKKEAEAATLLTEVLQQFPNKAEAYLLLGEISTRGVKPVKAEEILRRGIAKCPAHGVLHFNLAMVLNAQKKRTEAISVLEKAIQLGLGRLAPVADNLLTNWKRARSRAVNVNPIDFGK